MLYCEWWWNAVMFRQQERFRTYCTLLHMRLCMPPSSTVDIDAVTRSVPSAGTAEEQTLDSAPQASRLRSSSSLATDAKRSASDRYSYRAAVSAQADDWFAFCASPANQPAAFDWTRYSVGSLLGLPLHRVLVFDNKVHTLPTSLLSLNFLRISFISYRNIQLITFVSNRFIWSKVLKPVKIQSYTTKNIIYLDVSTSTDLSPTMLYKKTMW